MFNLIFFNNIILIDRLHGKELFSFFPFNKKDCSKSSSTKDNFRCKILKCDFFFEIFSGEKSLSGSSDHFSLFFFAFEILFISLIIMHYIVTFDFFGPLLFLFFFCGGIMYKTQFIFVINW